MLFKELQLLRQYSVKDKLAVLGEQGRNKVCYLPVIGSSYGHKVVLSMVHVILHQNKVSDPGNLALERVLPEILVCKIVVFRVEVGDRKELPDPSRIREFYVFEYYFIPSHSFRVLTASSLMSGGRLEILALWLPPGAM